MAYERYGRGDDEYARAQRHDRERGQDYYGAGELGYDRGDAGRADIARGYDRSAWGQGGDNSGRDDRPSGYGRRDYGQDYGQQSYGAQDYGRRDYGAQGSGQNRGSDSQDRDRDRFTGGDDFYRPDGGRGDYRQGRPSQEYRQGGQSGGNQNRGLAARAGDEVRSWFGDEQAERRREQDARDGERASRHARDEHYHDWRDQQIAAFDRDYHEFRQENRQKFHNEFSSWRAERQGQRDLLGRVTEHLEVVGADGEHVGTVDKVRGDQVILTKSDPDAGGRHHGVPSRWIKSVDGGKVTLTRTAAQAKQEWQDAERQGAMFGGLRPDDNGQTTGQAGATDLNRSFSGTY